MPGLIPKQPLMRVIEERLSRRSDKWTPEAMISAINEGRLETFLADSDDDDDIMLCPSADEEVE